MPSCCATTRELKRPCLLNETGTAARPRFPLPLPPPCVLPPHAPSACDVPNWLCSIPLACGVWRVACGVWRRIGKGFIVRLPDDDPLLEEEADAFKGRPPFLFVKCWAMDYGRLTGAVSVKYDVRDTGWRLTREHVSFAPEDPNKALLVWEEKKKRGIATVAVNSVKTLQFVGRIGKKREPQLNAANAPPTTTTTSSGSSNPLLNPALLKPVSANPLLRAAEEAKAKADAEQAQAKAQPEEAAAKPGAEEATTAAVPEAKPAAEREPAGPNALQPPAPQEGLLPSGASALPEEEAASGRERRERGEVEAALSTRQALKSTPGRLTRGGDGGGGGGGGGGDQQGTRTPTSEGGSSSNRNPLTDAIVASTTDLDFSAEPSPPPKPSPSAALVPREDNFDDAREEPPQAGGGGSRRVGKHGSGRSGGDGRHAGGMRGRHPSPSRGGGRGHSSGRMHRSPGPTDAHGRSPGKSPPRPPLPPAGKESPSSRLVAAWSDEVLADGAPRHGQQQQQQQRPGRSHHDPFPSRHPSGSNTRPHGGHHYARGRSPPRSASVPRALASACVAPGEPPLEYYDEEEADYGRRDTQHHRRASPDRRQRMQRQPGGGGGSGGGSRGGSRGGGRGRPSPPAPPPERGRRQVAVRSPERSPLPARDDGARDDGARDDGARDDRARDDRARDDRARDDGRRADLQPAPFRLHERSDRRPASRRQPAYTHGQGWERPAGGGGGGGSSTSAHPTGYAAGTAAGTFAAAAAVGRGRGASCPPRVGARRHQSDRSILMMNAASSGAFDLEHYQSFKAELDSYLHEREEEVAATAGFHTPLDGYLHEKDDPFFLSC